MSMADVTVTLTASTERFMAAMDQAQAALLEWFWAVWWRRWGTDGINRRTALVVWEKP